MNRRELLKWMGLSGGLLATPGLVWSASGADVSGERLVVIFLRGGADGLTLCPPLAEGAYFDARPTLAVAESDALWLDTFFGLHPAAGGLKTLFDGGDLAIVQACGLASAERSHFEAQAAMEQGLAPHQIATSDGWLGRFLLSRPGTTPLDAVALDTAIPQSMAGVASALAVGAIDDFSLQLDASARAALRDFYRGDPLLKPTAEAVFDAAEALEPIQAVPTAGAYPAGPLGVALADAARLIKADAGLRAAAINTGGWDTHNDQTPQINGLIQSLGDALLAFRNDLGSAWQSTTVVIQTEFGRRIAENASAGTDHGHGGVMMAAGGGVNGGQVFGDWPGLNTAALSDGQDLAVTTDYRQVLAELLTRRFDVVDVAPLFDGWQPGPWQGIFSPRAADAAAQTLHTGNPSFSDRKPSHSNAQPAISVPPLPHGATFRHQHQAPIGRNRRTETRQSEAPVGSNHGRPTLTSFLPNRFRTMIPIPSVFLASSRLSSSTEVFVIGGYRSSAPRPAFTGFSPRTRRPGNGQNHAGADRMPSRWCIGTSVPGQRLERTQRQPRRISEAAKKFGHAGGIAGRIIGFLNPCDFPATGWARYGKMTRAA